MCVSKSTYGSEKERERERLEAVPAFTLKTIFNPETFHLVIEMQAGSDICKCNIMSVDAVH